MDKKKRELIPHKPGIYEKYIKRPQDFILSVIAIIVLFLDDNPNIRECMGYPVIGKVKGAKEYPGAKFIVAIGNPEIRQKIQEQLEIGKGIVVMARRMAA